jgi:hypothetical protein
VGGWGGGNIITIIYILRILYISNLCTHLYLIYVYFQYYNIININIHIYIYIYIYRMYTHRKLDVHIMRKLQLAADAFAAAPSLFLYNCTVKNVRVLFYLLFIEIELQLFSPMLSLL